MRKEKLKQPDEKKEYTMYYKAFWKTKLAIASEEQQAE